VTEPLHTVLVPGLGCSALLWEALLPVVWEHGSLSIADTRRDDTMAGMADRLLAAAPDRFALTGLSMGGYVSLEVMRRAPERVVGLALVSTNARDDTPEQLESRHAQIALVEGGKYDDLVASALPLLLDPANVDDKTLIAFWRDMAHQVGPEAFVTQLRAVLAREDSRPTLAAIGCPTAVVHGAGDQLMAVELAHETAAGIAGAELTVVDGGGHMVAREQPAEVGAALDAWLHRVRA
jgi:pimeloyl-ACP methyl ester carboxylesterase